jgi:hypothetical protein
MFGLGQRTGVEGQMKRSTILGVCLFATGVAGCTSDPVGFACTADFRYGLSITVLEGSGGPAADGALGIAVDGDYTEMLEVIGSETMVGAGERPGTYDIDISKFGYMTWSAENITVTADECHVIPVSLDAVLIPVP